MHNMPLSMLCLALLLHTTGADPAPAAAQSSFPIQVNDTSGLDAPWPLVCGLPFHEGLVNDASTIRIFSGDREIPAQIDTAATWRDGSIQWALASFVASPRAAYHAEYGAEAGRRPPRARVHLQRAPDGVLTVDTDRAVYTFLPDRLLPEQARLDHVTILSNSGDGAYLVDNRGRRARVAGPAAGVTTDVLKDGPIRIVLRREGWYVTADGDRVARARAWFTFFAGCPFMKITHSLILTEDTNDLWIRDLGLEFKTPRAPRRAVFALGAPGQETLFATVPEGRDVFMLQETYPHFLESDSRAMIGEIADGTRRELTTVDVAGDWAEAEYDGYGLTVVMPWLAQQFPKEIAVGPTAVKAAFWSARAGRELDFRAKTLVDEYWGQWVHQTVRNADANVKPWIEKYWELDREPEGAEALAKWPSNAQGAARTHDLWLLPHATRLEEDELIARARAAARPPLVLADPVWLCDTKAVGWPMHPRDPKRFPRAEALISNYWERLTQQFVSLPRTGFIAWGGQPYLSTGKMFRHGILADYGLRRSVWGLYARSGERRYHDVGARFNRHIADWWVAHWTAGRKIAGGVVSPGGYWEGHLPFIWGKESQPLSADSSGDDVHNFLLEHYLTGDEYVLHVHRMIGDAMKEHWWDDATLRQETGVTLKRWHIPMVLRILVGLYTREWDQRFRDMAHRLSRHLIDMDNPNGLTDKMHGGALYKWERNVHALYEYHRATGDPLARAAILKALDYNYRFGLVSPPFSSTNHGAFLYAAAYRWTGRRGYLRLVNDLVETSIAQERLPGAPHTCAHPTMGVPSALALLAEVDEPVAPFPLLSFAQTEVPSTVVLHKAAGKAAELGVYLRLSAEVDEEATTAMEITDARTRPVDRVRIEEQKAFRSARSTRSGYARDRHLTVALPAELPGGEYRLRFPLAAEAKVLDSTAESIGTGAAR